MEQRAKKMLDRMKQKGKTAKPPGFTRPGVPSPSRPKPEEGFKKPPGYKRPGFKSPVVQDPNRPGRPKFPGKGEGPKFTTPVVKRTPGSKPRPNRMSRKLPSMARDHIGTFRKFLGK